MPDLFSSRPEICYGHSEVPPSLAHPKGTIEHIRQTVLETSMSHQFCRDPEVLEAKPKPEG